MTILNILSGGAAQGLVAGFAEAFKMQTGFNINGQFGAVGVMADKLRGGTPADLVILTSTLVAKLADEGLVLSASISDIGLIETALAVRAGDPKAIVKDAMELRRTFLAADEIFVPDTKTSTAGIHVAKVLERLGIADEVASRLRVLPNGAAAMRQLAASHAKRPIGCTQSSEIIAAEGIVLSGALPPGCELATMYAAAITAQSANARQARILIDLLTSAAHGDQRVRAGFAA